MNSFWDKNKIPLSIIVGASIIGLFIYLTNQPKTASVSVDIKSASPTPVATREPSATSFPTSLPSPTVDDTAAIKTAVAIKLNQKETDLEINISKNTGSFAKGTIKEKASEVGGGYFLAAKADGSWVIVYDGQSQPPCKDLETYKFPNTIAPECLNTAGQVVKR